MSNIDEPIPTRSIRKQMLSNCLNAKFALAQEVVILRLINNIITTGVINLTALFRNLNIPSLFRVATINDHARCNVQNSLSIIIV